MTKSLWLLALPPAALALAACAAASSPSSQQDGANAAAAAAPASAAEAEDGESEETVALSAVPSSVLTAGQGAVSGITFSSAEREVEGGATVYSLRGTANGKCYEVEVTADGKVVEVEDCNECEECEGGEDR